MPFYSLGSKAVAGQARHKMHSQLERNGFTESRFGQHVIAS